MRRFLVVLLLFLLWLPAHSLSADTLSADERAKLEAQLKEVEAAQAQAEKELANAKGKSSSLANDITVLQAKIKAAQLEVKAMNLQIKTLGDNITTKQKTITTLEGSIARNRGYITSLFQQLHQADGTEPVTVLLTDPGLTGYAKYASQIETVELSLLGVVSDLKNDTQQNTREKEALVTKKNSAVDARYDIEQVQKGIEADQAQLKKLLSVSKSNEKAYSTVISEQKKIAAAINARLFELAGGGGPIQFGDAYKYSLVAKAKTGIDPAYLLAVMTQETNLGSNQGTCYLTDTSTGTGKSAKSGREFPNVMHPTRDVPVFLSILEELGKTVANTKVSCPQSIGWGGAMGPAQFIPSTWKMFAPRVASAVGKPSANPWNPQDAFMAAALYLTDLGAASGGYTAQSNAACRYYSGSSCGKSSLVASYGTSVMQLAAKIQANEIDKLNALK